jgi:hypothetical protein
MRQPPRCLPGRTLQGHWLGTYRPWRSADGKKRVLQRSVIELLVLLRASLGQ